MNISSYKNRVSIWGTPEEISELSAKLLNGDPIVAKDYDGGNGGKKKYIIARFLTFKIGKENFIADINKSGGLVIRSAKKSAVKKVDKKYKRKKPTKAELLSFIDSINGEEK